MCCLCAAIPSTLGQPRQSNLSRVQLLALIPGQIWLPGVTKGACLAQAPPTAEATPEATMEADTMSSWSKPNTARSQVVHAWHGIAAGCC